jgi:hypothetical protein
LDSYDLPPIVKKSLCIGRNAARLLWKLNIVSRKTNVRQRRARSTAAESEVFQYVSGMILTLGASAFAQASYGDSSKFPDQNPGAFSI